MPNTIVHATLSDKKILNKICLVRRYKVMLDFDLADLYSVDTGHLKRQVRRNINRFPKDFMFQLTPEEYDSLRCQFGILEQGQHSKYLPMAFTEQGVAMLSSVLNSPTAIKVNIQIIRVFTKMREVILTHKNILIKIEQIEKKLLKQDFKMKKYDEDLLMIFAALKKLFNPPTKPRPRIGFRRKDEQD